MIDNTLSIKLARFILIQKSESTYESKVSRAVPKAVTYQRLTFYRPTLTRQAPHPRFSDPRPPADVFPAVGYLQTDNTSAIFISRRAGRASSDLDQSVY